jgi:hypothetical protein
MLNSLPPIPPVKREKTTGQLKPKGFLKKPSVDPMKSKAISFENNRKLKH